MAKKRGNSTSNRNESGQFEPAYDWPTVVPQILDRIMAGESINAFAGTEGMPCKRAIMYECLKPEWAGQYQTAMEVRAELDGVEIDDTAAKVASGEYTPQQGRVIGDILHKRMAQRAPKKYNERIQTVTHTHKVEVSMRPRLERAKKRELERLRASAEIITDAEYVVVDEGDE